MVYRNVFDLPNVGLALSLITEAREHSLLQTERTVRNMLTRVNDEEAIFTALSRTEPQTSY